MWAYFRDGFIAAHKRRPVSFYLLLLIPIALLLGAHIADQRQSPGRFATLLSLLLLFFWLITVHAFNDLFRLLRKHRIEKRAAYLDTIGDPDFAVKLGAKVKGNQQTKNRE